MHELGIMDAVLAAVTQSAAEAAISRVRTVRLVVGRRHGALPDALRFAFEVLTSEDGLFRGAVLEIDERPVRARCRTCGLEYGEETEGLGWAWPCPRCGAPAPEILAGNELFVDFYEGE